MAKLACVASVSVRFKRKERGTRVKDRAKNGASKRAGGGGGVGKKGRKRLQINPTILKTTHLACPCLTVHAPTFDAVISCSFLPFPSPIFYFLVLVSFLARSNRNSPSTVSSCSETKRKRLLRRLLMAKRTTWIIERRRMTSCYYGSSIFGGQQNQRRRRRQGEQQK